MKKLALKETKAKIFIKSNSRFYSINWLKKIIYK